MNLKDMTCFAHEMRNDSIRKEKDAFLPGERPPFAK